MALLDNILADPLSGKKLRMNWSQSSIDSLDNNLFFNQIEDGIPIILPLGQQRNIANTNLHQEAASDFDYVDHYKKDAAFFDYCRPYESKVLQDELTRLHEYLISHTPNKASVLLDVGCGSGWLSHNQVSDDRQVISMDISLTNTKKALDRTPHPNHYGLVADVFHLPLAEASVDCVVASEIIEHVQDPKMFIQQLLKPLKKGGKLIISTPYHEKLVYHLCVHCNKPTPSNAHLHSFHEGNIEDLIPGNSTYWTHKTFSNKWLIKLRLSRLLRFLPFGLWRRVDQVFNWLLKRPSRLLLVIVK